MRVELSWAEATVGDGTLTVPLEGKAPPGWRESFERTVQLLGAREWGKIEVKKRTIRVRNVRAGDEDTLRHYLEGVVEQANAAQDPARADAQETDEPPGDGRDAEMTNRFRAFADEDSTAGG